MNHFVPVAILASILLAVFIVFRIQEWRNSKNMPMPGFRKGGHARKVYFLLSQSGGGKDTQAGKILGLFQQKGIKYIYTSIGDRVRSTVGELGPEDFFAKNMKYINDAGKLQPAVLPMYFFLGDFLGKYTGNEVLVINGSPRSEAELHLWASLINTGYLPEARIIHLDVSDEECIRRLQNRPGRPDTEDDTARKTKLAWYGPIRKMLKKRLPAGFELVTINGERSADETFEELKEYFKSENILT